MALTLTVLAVLYAALRPAGPGFGRFGYAFEYDVVTQVLFPVTLALCLVDVLYWRGRWVELAARSARAVTVRLVLGLGLLLLALGSVWLVWLVGRVDAGAGSPTSSVRGVDQLLLAIGNLTLALTFAAILAAFVGAGAAVLVTGVLLVAQLALGGSAGERCNPATALLLCSPDAGVSPGRPVWVALSAALALAVVVLGDGWSYRRYSS